MSNWSNGGLANGGLDKRELELGDRSTGCTPKYKQQRVSAVREFPVECGMRVGHGLDSTDETDKGNPLGLNHKFRRGRVSAIRDFPLHCGPNLIGPPAQGLPVLLKRDEMGESSVSTVETMLTGTKIHGAEKSMFPDSKYTNGSQASTVKEAVLLSQYRDQESKSLKTTSGTIVEDGKEVIQAIMAGPYSSWRHDKSSSSNSLNAMKDGEMNKDTIGWSGGNKAVSEKSKYTNNNQASTVEEAVLVSQYRDQESKSLKTTSGTIVEDGKEVIQAIMAGPYSPWKHDKSSSSNSLDAMKDGEMKKDTIGWSGGNKAVSEKSKYTNGNQASTVKEAVLVSQYRDQESKPLKTTSGTIVEDGKEVIQAVMAGPYSPWKHDKSSSSNSLNAMKDGEMKKDTIGWSGGNKGVSKNSKHTNGNQASTVKEAVLVSQYRDQESKSLKTTSGTIIEDGKEVIQAIMAGPYSPRKHDKSSSSNSLNAMKDGEMKKDTIGWSGGNKAVSKKSTLGGDLPKRNSFRAKKFVYRGSTQGKANGRFDTYAKGLKAASSLRASSLQNNASCFSPPHGSYHDEIFPPTSGKSSGSSDERKRVKETLRFFQLQCRKLLQEKEAKRRGEHQEKLRRIDLAAVKKVRNELKEVNKGKIIGVVPGVEVGDEFQYRVELALIGVHNLYQAGIDYVNRGGKLLAISVVASGAYADDMENAEVLIYSGHGGNVVGKKKQNPEDQKLVRGNLALKNSIREGNLVRVIRGSKENKMDKIVTTYIYDGLYKVHRYYTERGPHGKMVFMFELKREPGQPELSWKEVKLSKKYKKRQGVCVDDISCGKESFPVCAVNKFNNEKPPAFTYITKMMYPDWFRPHMAKGCDCNGRCSESRKCSCAVKNGGDIPYNYNGAIVETKRIVFECGPSCKCPPSCYNRVTQRGSNVQLEIFKTKSRGWGVRSLSFIPSGTFICEYIGELLEEKEAEQRSNDEYLFDIGRNGNDSNREGTNPIDAEDEGGYTIDAARYGNVGRFVNHSCSPNLYAQDVLNDHDDPRMPHIMLFAAEDIASLQELTYNYNYSVDQVRDSDGNIKVKKCYCGSIACTGRMY